MGVTLWESIAGVALEDTAVDPLELVHMEVTLLAATAADPLAPAAATLLGNPSANTLAAVVIPSVDTVAVREAVIPSVGTVAVIPSVDTVPVR